MSGVRPQVMDVKKWIMLGTLACVAVCVIYGIAVALLFWDAGGMTPGAFGDMFGGLTALVTALGFLALLFTILLQLRSIEQQREVIENQNTEIDLLRKEMEHSRIELSRAAEAQEHAAMAQKRAAETLERAVVAQERAAETQELVLMAQKRSAAAHEETVVAQGRVAQSVLLASLLGHLRRHKDDPMVDRRDLDRAEDQTLSKVLLVLTNIEDEHVRRNVAGAVKQTETQIPLWTQSRVLIGPNKNRTIRLAKGSPDSSAPAETAIDPIG